MRGIKKLLAWTWAHMGNFVQIALWIGAFAVTAWAAKAAELFSAYAPFSWVASGLVGGCVVSLSYWVFASARSKWVRSKYDNTMMLRGSLVDPLAKTFEGKRIYLSEFVLPSHQLISGKTFIDCEIIGPANIWLITQNNVSEGRSPLCDAIALKAADTPLNVVFIDRCTFRGCSFHRITFLISEGEIDQTRHVNWLNWIGHTPEPTQRNLELNDGPPQDPDARLAASD